MTISVAFALAAALGGMARLSLDSVLRARLAARRDRRTPTDRVRDNPGVGIAAVNVLGSFLIGLLATLPISADLFFVLGAGFSGAFTTLSTAILDVVNLWRARQRRASITLLAATLVCSLVACGGGMALGAAL